MTDPRDEFCKKLDALESGEPAALEHKDEIIGEWIRRATAYLEFHAVRAVDGQKETFLWS